MIFTPLLIPFAQARLPVRVRRGRRRTELKILISVLMVLGGSGALACPLRLPVMSVELGEVVLELEIAATPQARSCGLSRRAQLDADRGMLFVVPEPRIMNFWMLDTTLPLDIAFVGGDGRIVSIQSMKPLQTDERYLSPEPVRFAIEVNGGWFAQHGVEVGDVVDIRLPGG